MESAWVAARSVLQAIAEHNPAAGWTPLTTAQDEALDAFSVLYRQHLDDENTIAYPAAQAVLSEASVQAMSQDMMQRRGVAPRK